jgi:pimeloyl-ACP methyl ester carboxylesterase
MSAFMVTRTHSIRYCRTPDDVRRAYSSMGSGAALVQVTTWLNPTELNPRCPVWAPRIEAFTKQYNFVMYDGRGCGLSDRGVEDFSFGACVRDLETVVDSARLDRVSILGDCTGCAVAVAYAIRHPERVHRLVLYGAFARGRFMRHASDEELAEAKTMLDLIRVGWGEENSVFRRVCTTLFMSDTTPEQAAWFTQLQRASTSAGNAVRFISTFDAIDIFDLLPHIRCPTLVIRSNEDPMVPLEEARRVAGAIPGAEFVALERRNHILLPHQSAFLRFLDEIASVVSQQRLYSERPFPKSRRLSWSRQRAWGFRC